MIYTEGFGAEFVRSEPVVPHVGLTINAVDAEMPAAYHAQILAADTAPNDVNPNLSKEKLYIFVKLFCEQRNLSCPKARTIGRIIADQPDKMRSRPIKVRSNGQRIERKRALRAENPKATKPALPASVELSTRWSTFWMQSEDT